MASLTNSKENRIARSVPLVHIKDKVVLITGASEGIGAACARVFRGRGARLALTARSFDKLREVGGPDALIVAGDVTSTETRTAVVTRTVQRYGGIDILINNAGVGLYAPAWSAPIAEVRHMFELNFFALLEMVQLTSAVMRKQRRGTIVNIGSIAGKVTLPWFTLYSASKFAVGSLTDGLRMELRRDGIHAMTVCPGYVSTGFQSHVLAGQPPLSVQRSRTFKITAGQCAEAIARGVERNARTVVTPRAGWLFVMMERLFPGLVDAQMERMYQSET
jgi:short-subunit dehydrogenase